MNITGTNIEHLNEYCLFDIFSLYTLDLIDLCNIAETCKRFEQIVRRVVPRHFHVHKGCDFTTIYMRNISSRRLTFTAVETSDLKRIFKRFGSLLTKIGIHSVGYNSYNFNHYDAKLQFLKLVAMNCVGNLKTLNIKSQCTMKIPRALVIELNPIFKQLETVQLDGVFFDCDKTQIANFHSLVKLNLINVRNCGTILLKKVYPKLEAFTYISNSDVQTLSPFILRNPTLKYMFIRLNSYDDEHKITIPQAIANSCKNLEELRIGGLHYRSSIYFQPLQELKSLRVLCIENVRVKDLKVFAPMTALRELSIRHSTLPKDSSEFAVLSSLTQLKHLRVSGYDGNGVINIITHLTHLERILIYWEKANASRFELDETTFLKIVRLVQNRPNVLELVCKFNFDAKSYGRDVMVKLIQLAE